MGRFSKNISIAASYLTGWLPMSFALNPIFTHPIAVTAELNFFRRVSWFMYLTVPSFMNEHMVVFRFAPGSIRVFCTKAAADWTIHSTGSPVDLCAFLSKKLPFFWSYKVRVTAWD